MKHFVWRIEGNDKINEILTEFLAFNLGSAHVAFLLRGVSLNLKTICKNDPRLENRQVEFDDKSGSNITFCFSSIELGLYENNGLKSLLCMLEKDLTTEVKVNTQLEFPESIYSIKIFKDPHKAICNMSKGFDISSKYGSDENWEQLYKEMSEAGDIDQTFSKHEYSYNLDDFYKRINNGVPFVAWLYYIYLLYGRKKLRNYYLKTVLDNSDGIESFKTNVLDYIISVSHKNADFEKLYLDRKKIVKQYPESDVAVFVSNNRINPEESVYKLTDNTLVEKKEIIADIAQHGMPNDIEKIYPELALYLKKYYFKDDALSDLLTEYFDEYKKQKVLNKLDDEFLREVDELAKGRVYNRLRTRNELVDSSYSDDAYLLWIDALGVEYLSFIEETAKKKGLSVSIKIGRAELPTITSINKSFYENWKSDNKRKIEELDELKHKEKGGYKYGPSNLYAIHLAEELQIISNAIDEAATDLGLRRYDNYIITGDHGASRLAVLRNKKEKYETETQGKHSGRCCMAFEDYDLPFATEENGFIVLADYGRFLGSRAANVEVHGGASLEEVLVPVISLRLKDNSIQVKMVDNVVKADRKDGISFTIYINKLVNKKVSINYKGTFYKCDSIDDNHYRVDIPDIKQAGKVKLDVFLDDNLTSHLEFDVTSKSASINSDFDDLF